MWNWKWDKTVVILTFTWSVGLRLADCHMRHLNLVHSWRLEWGREWGWQMKNTGLYSVFSGHYGNISTRMKTSPRLKPGEFLLICVGLLLLPICGACNCCFSSYPLIQHIQKHILKTRACEVQNYLLPGTTCIFYACLSLGRKRCFTTMTITQTLLVIFHSLTLTHYTPCILLQTVLQQKQGGLNS